jgi:hypothetical protein
MNMTYTEKQEEIKLFDREHGSFFDRGSADSYYGRARDPHRGGVGGMSGPRIEATDQADIHAYNAGYDYNEEYGDKKNYE